MIKNILIIGLTFFKFYAFAQVFSCTYGFPEVTTNTGMTDPSQTPTVNGLQLSSFTSQGTSLNPSASARFSFTGWPLGSVDGDDNYGNFLGQLSPTVYYEVSVSVDPGYTLNLNSLSFDVRRSGTGIRTYCVRSSLDNYTTNLAASTGTNSKLEIIPTDIFFWKYDSISTNNDQKGSRIDFSSVFSAITGSLTFRFYAWNSEANGGSFSLDNVNFKGELKDSTQLTDIEQQWNNSTSVLNLEVYPNPCQDGVLKLKNNSHFTSLKLINACGQECLSNKFDQSTEVTQLDMSELTNGLYTLLMFNDMGSKKMLIWVNKP